MQVGAGLHSVGIGEFMVSTSEEAVLVTYALGSCVAVIAHDPRLKVGGLIHFMLPSSNAHRLKAHERPGLFADTGVPALFRALYAAGCHKSGLVVKVVGGGALLNVSRELDVGRRNLEALEVLFERNGVRVAALDVGGMVSRTVSLNVGTGQVLVRSHRREREL